MLDTQIDDDGTIYYPPEPEDDGHNAWPDGSPWAPTPSGHVEPGGGYYGWPTPQTTPPPPAPPPTSTTTPAPTGSGGGGTNYDSGGFQWPQFHAPALPDIAPLVAPPPFSYEPFSFESYRAPDPFTYDSFTAPTKEQAAEEPGYAFGLEQGMGALKNALAARGVYRTGAAPKEFFTWANRAAEQNYGNVYNRATNTYSLNRNNAFENFATNERNRAESYDRNRNNAFGTWDANRGNALNAYTTNWGVTKDTFGGNLDRSFGLWDRDFQGKKAEFDPTFSAASMQFDDLYRRWKAELDATTSIATAGAGG